MTDPEFESYLSLLGGLLRLSARQREGIRRELRDHLEASVEAQLERGVPRDLAVRQALEEFGDAAELAARFSALRPKRWMMKGSLLAACVSVAFLSIQSFMSQSGSGERGATAAARATPQRDTAGREPTGNAADEAIRASLRTLLERVDMTEMPLSDVFDYMASVTKVNVHVQWSMLEDQGVARDTPVTVKLANVSAERVLRLVLDEFADTRLGYDVLDGVVIVSTAEALLRDFETRVYDVYGILCPNESDPGNRGSRFGERAARPQPGGAGGTLGAATDPSATSGGAAPGTGIGGEHRNEPRPTAGPADERSERLLDVVRGATGQDLWEAGGGTGYLELFDGMLVVRHSRSVQNAVASLLDGLRRGDGKPE